MRVELRVLRAKTNQTQQSIAARTGISVATYNLIENGKRRGSIKFWQMLQKEFGLTDAEIWKAQQNI